MEDRGRPFEPIKIGMSSIETGQERFSSEEHTSPPIPAFWRLNLTALSQKYNLYFVAIGSLIQVYEPQFPFQKLGNKPKLTIIPQLANAGAPGYINARHPHFVNNLIIGQLGEQEVLLLSTDSGNVTGYQTRAVVNAIRHYATNTITGSTTFTHADIRPFFTQWVFESAWGLSIHSKGRMIAVSANVSSRCGVETVHGLEDRASVTIFAFALTTDHSDNESEDSTDLLSEMPEVDKEWKIWNPNIVDATISSPRRHRNYKIVLAGLDGHATNVPHISFFNNVEDLDGAWLLSTDISEKVKLWQIWSGRCVKNWEFGDHGGGGAAWLGIDERGWIAATLDRQAFQLVSDLESFIGHGRAPQHYAYGGQGDSFDITNVVRYRVPSNGHNHPLNDSDSDGDSSISEDSIRVDQDLSDFGSTTDEVEVQRLRSELEVEATSWRNAPQSSEIDEFPESLSTNQPVDMEDDSDEISSEEDNFEVQSDFSEGNASGHDVQTRPTPNSESTTSISSCHTGNSSPNSSHNCHSSPTPGKAPQSEDIDMSSEQFAAFTASNGQPQKLTVPNVPFIYCSTSHLRLFNGPDSKTPHLFCARILRQAISTTMEDQGIIQMDRLDMIEQLPEIGVVIIATQIGRCAICSLTKRTKDGLFGLRVDWVLPTQKQERAGIRPHMPLHGIAVSPVPRRHYGQFEGDTSGSTEYWTRNRVVSGVATTFDKTTLDMSDVEQHTFQDARNSSGASPVTMSVKTYDWSKQRSPESWTAVDGKRHYRLMMTYADMTVLTYEISRGVERHDIRVD